MPRINLTSSRSENFPPGLYLRMKSEISVTGFLYCCFDLVRIHNDERKRSLIESNLWNCMNESAKYSFNNEI